MLRDSVSPRFILITFVIAGAIFLPYVYFFTDDIRPVPVQIDFVDNGMTIVFMGNSEAYFEKIEFKAENFNDFPVTLTEFTFNIYSDGELLTSGKVIADNYIDSGNEKIISVYNQKIISQTFIDVYSPDNKNKFSFNAKGTANVTTPYPDLEYNWESVNAIFLP